MLPSSSGPWLNYQYPSQWECDDDFMGVHFQHRNSDSHVWSSQCLFWSEAIALYAQQLLAECPYKYNRLSFTAHDIVVAHTRSNRMEPWCILDILHFMKEEEGKITLLSDIEQRYQSLNGITLQTATDNNQYRRSKTEASMLSLSGVSSMFTSMIQYVVPIGTQSETDESDLDSDIDSDHNGEHRKHGMAMDDGSKVIYVPLMEELCQKVSKLSFYNKSLPQSDLSQLIEIGTIRIEDDGDEFMINGLVFARFCTEVLGLTFFDVQVLKKWLIVFGQIRLFYIKDGLQWQWTESGIAESFCSEILNPVLDDHSVHQLKDEFIYFNAKRDQMTISKEQMTKMQLLSIQMTMKRLCFQKTANESNLDLLNQQLMAKLKKVPSSKRKEVLQRHAVLLKKKKWLKQRIATLDGSIFNLETTLSSMEDLTINKMVFEEMKNADKMLKAILETAPTIEDIEEMKEEIQHSMNVTSDIGLCLAKPMETDTDREQQEEEELLLLAEYEQMEKDNVQQALPDVPSHDILVPQNGHIHHENENEKEEANDGDIEIDGNDDDQNQNKNQNQNQNRQKNGKIEKEKGILLVAE